MRNIKNVDLGMLPADGIAGNIFLLAIQGKLKSRSLDESRTIHNATAGDPQGVATARSLGDLSHNVYVSATEPESGAFLILDRWTSMEGLQRFFADLRVQEGGGQIFAEREPGVWAPTAQIASFSLPTPKDEAGRFVGVLRATVKSRETAERTWNEAVVRNLNKARLHGQVSQAVHYRVTPPDQPSNEVLAVSTWTDLDGMLAFYRDGSFMNAFTDLFTAPPATSIWAPPAGEWVEW